DKIWVNIYLPIDNTNEGCIVAQTDSWTDAVTINFDIKDSDGKASFYWLTNSIFWGIYDDDNKTLWDDGAFENKTNFPLNVELGSFTATLLENENVFLKWTTVSSFNSTGFEIEKRASSSTTPVQDWEKIGFIESAGNSEVLMEYSLVDVTPHKSSVVQYRLKTVYLDGTFSYSNVVEVQTAPINFELAQNYPNPFNPSTKIVLRLPQTTEMKLVVYNLLGEVVSELANAEYQAGTHEFNFDAAGLASGVYIYRVESADYTDTKKMVLLR
ncbi:MAG: T9SS type A sorting domain-containing protein, partial [Candidatus Lokiarchaeota archaeon]|nr:T9SS type A sorting domain-containing protein [Candidatus Lokiarchaeota archaeon]